MPVPYELHSSLRNIVLNSSVDYHDRKVILNYLLDHERVAPEQVTRARHVAQMYLTAGKRITAIKEVRKNTGWGLKEAKDYVDEIKEEMERYGTLTKEVPF